MRAPIRIRLAFGFVTTASLGLVVAIAACGDDNARTTFAPDSGSDGTANLPSEGDGSLSPPPAPDARPPFDPADEPVTCTASPCAVELVAGADHFCVRLSDATVRCWGDDIWGELGRGEEDTTDAGAIPPVALSNVMQVSAGGYTTCARLGDGSVHCWGANYQGELGLDPAGIADEERHPTPTPVALDGAYASRIDVGNGSACAMLTTGTLLCWGDDQFAKLARPDGGGPADQTLVIGPGATAIGERTFAAIHAGTKTILGLTPNGEVFSWGAISGDDGLVSGRVSSKSPDTEPKRVTDFGKVTSLAVSPILWREPNAKQSDGHRPGGPGIPPHAHACAIAEGRVFCWGHSFTGALCTGLPDRQQQPASAPVAATAWPQQVAVGDETSCVRMTDGTVQCCGEDINGALARGGLNGFGPFFATATEFTSYAVHVAASRSAICALVQGGTVECWGGNVHGELGGAPDQDPHPTPTKIVF